MLIGAFIAGSAYAQGTGKPDAGNADVQEVRSSTLAFRLQKCHYEASMITCDFTVTPLDRDVAINIFGDRHRRASRIITYESTEYIANSIQLAGKEVTSTKAPLVSGTVAKGQFVFNSVSQKPTKISLLKLQGARTTDKGAGVIYFEAEFRNIALQ